jgi:hypothetical protein
MLKGVSDFWGRGALTSLNVGSLLSRRLIYRLPTAESNPTYGPFPLPVQPKRKFEDLDSKGKVKYSSRRVGNPRAPKIVPSQ